MPSIDLEQFTQERIVFRLIKTPCCGQLLCWVNPRLPNYCPECGVMIFSALLGTEDCILVKDETARLRLRRI